MNYIFIFFIFFTHFSYQMEQFSTTEFEDTVLKQVRSKYHLNAPEPRFQVGRVKIENKDYFIYYQIHEVINQNKLKSLKFLKDL